MNISISTKKNDTKPTKVIISGDNVKNVEECAKEINVCEKIFEIPKSCVGDLKKRATKLIEDYKIKQFFISNEEKKDEEGQFYKAPNVTIIGNSQYIDELYHNEIKNYDYDNYESYENYDKYKTSNSSNIYLSGTYRKSNKRYNNYYNNYNQENYKYKK